MLLKSPVPSTPRGRSRWWREWEILFLLLLVAGAYLLRVGDLSIRGEEPRRAQVALEILQSGDWIVPHQQGTIYNTSRPPLQNWLIAFSMVLSGTREAWAIRLHSVLAMLLTAWLIYGYARTALSRTGALSASVAFVTLGEMLTIGCQAETDMLFTFLTASALLLWHWGTVEEWPEWVTWTSNYAFVGLGLLCKGPQTPLYFALAVGSYSLVLSGPYRKCV